MERDDILFKNVEIVNTTSNMIMVNEFYMKSPDEEESNGLGLYCQTYRRLVDKIYLNNYIESYNTVIYYCGLSLLYNILTASKHNDQTLITSIGNILKIIDPKNLKECNISLLKYMSNTEKKNDSSFLRDIMKQMMSNTETYYIYCQRSRELSKFLEKIFENYTDDIDHSTYIRVVRNNLTMLVKVVEIFYTTNNQNYAKLLTKTSIPDSIDTETEGKTPSDIDNQSVTNTEAKGGANSDPDGNSNDEEFKIDSFSKYAE